MKLSHVFRLLAKDSGDGCASATNRLLPEDSAVDVCFLDCQSNIIYDILSLILITPRAPYLFSSGTHGNVHHLAYQTGTRYFWRADHDLSLLCFFRDKIGHPHPARLFCSIQPPSSVQQILSQHT